MGKIKFSVGWKSTLLTVIVVPLCFSLGLWQLERSVEKEEIAASYQNRAQMTAITINDVDSFIDKTNLPVTLSGVYTGQHLLLENQWRRKKLGVEVLSLFETKEGQRVLINRGWIENKDRNVVPIFETPSNIQILQTLVYQPSKAPYSLGDLILDKAVDIQRLSYLDIEQISQQLEIELYPLSFRLNESNSFAFDTNWPEINVKPETHIGYAVQWFLFAALALIVFLFANSNLGTLIRKRDK